MSTEAHPQAVEALDQLKRFNSALEDHVHRTTTETYTATDEAESVKVVLDGNRTLTGLYLEEGLLRLGAETVQNRINEALLNAQAAAESGFEANQQQLLATLTDAANELIGILRQS